MKSPKSTKNIFEINWQDNPLSEYANYTYYIRLFMLSERDEIEVGSNLELLENREKVIIAESGSTTFNIKSLQIDSVVTPSSQYGLGTLRSITMNIFEPTGLTFYDKLFTAAFALGIKDLFRYPLYLEISFKGENDEGKLVPLYINGNEKWVFKVLITDVGVSYDEKGSSYTIECVLYDDIGQSDAYQVVNIPFRARAVTVKDVLDSFIEAKKQEELDHYGYERNRYHYKVIPLDTRELENTVDIKNIDPNPLNWKLTTLRTDVPNRRRSPETFMAKEFNFPAKMKLEDIIKEVFVNTNEGRKLILKIDNPITENGKYDDFSIIWSIETKVYIRDDEPYDYIVRDYNKNIVFIIKPYITPRGIISRKQLSSVENSKENEQKEKLLKRVRTGRLVKKYDYYYTGNNTEIINATFELDHLYKAIIPLYGGTNSEFLSELAEVKQNLYINEPLKEKFNILAKNKEIYKNIRKAAVESQTARTPVSIIDREVFLRQEIKRYASEINMELAKKYETERNKFLIGKSTGNVRFLEDFSPNNLEIAKFISIMIDKSSRDLMTMFKGSIESEEPIMTSLSIAVLNQIMSKSLMNLTLEIKGDPYWLGKTGLITSESNKIIDDNPLQGALYESGDIMFMFRMKIPRLNDKTGEVTFDDKNIFTGIYIPTHIIHKFTDGLFTQTIDAVRDVTVDINIINELGNI